MDKRNRWVTRLFLIFFTISVSVAVLPCGIINARGLFREEITSTVVEDKEQEIVNIKSIDHKKAHTAKGENILNVWFEILIEVVCISFCANLVKLPRKDTIVTLKVRMDN
jgi:hypothetical protein